MTLTDAQMNKILRYLLDCYKSIEDTDYIYEDNYIYFPPLEFLRNKEGKWVPQ